MNKLTRIALVVALIIMVALVVYTKQERQTLGPGLNMEDAVTAQESDAGPAEHRAPNDDPPAKGLPRLVDLGASKCIPCKMMAPILDELKEEHKDEFEVVVLDVSKDPEPARRYKIRIIPTQIFFDPSGKELYRHEGFLSKEDILRKWKELGINLEERQKE